MNPLLKKKLSILIHLAGVDGEFARTEKLYIMAICERNGVSKSECQQLIDNPEPIGSLGALSYNKVVEYMSDSLSLMISDGKIRKSEIILCEDIGLRLGFTKAAVDKTIEKLKLNLNMSNEQVQKLVSTMAHHGKV